MSIVNYKRKILTDEQKSAIITILKKQCDLIEERNRSNQDDYPELYDKEYMKGRKHNETALVYAGFQENTKVPDMTIKKFNYGKGLCLPELTSKNVIIQIYKDTADFKNNEILSKCAKYNGMDSEIKYAIIKFWMSEEGHLEKVKLVELSEEAKQIASELLYEYHKADISIVA